MTPDHDRWREIDRLFEAALGQPPAGRQAFVEKAAGGDRQLLAAVLELLRAERDSAGLFEAPGAAASSGLVEDLAGRAAYPRRIGRYDIVREIGRGGMGTVYLAEHEGDGFRQKVAVKVLRRGVDTDDVLRRFVNERRILAALTHPNIARLYDGGATDDGRPYLVMEFVEGEPITTYCDERRLTVRQRLELAIEVAGAVRAAHAALVVHRDLKASNILVSADGHVKLLDFGIAKLLDGDAGAEHTKTGLLVLTPDHASPEQLRGEPVTTATDVFQLGVLMFRLLTGRAPYRAPADVRDIPRPSSVAPPHLRRALAGDLDRIVGKALQEEPARRYASVEALSSDIRRFLDGRTISARPETLAYRLGTYLRRHPLVAPAALALTAFAALYAVTLVRHTRALETERNAATLQAERAQEVQRFMVELFGSANPYAPADPDAGRRITVVEALDVGVGRLRTSLADRPAIRAAILSAISQAYQDLGVYDRSLPLREEALALQESVHGPGSREVRDSLGSLAVLRGQLGAFEQAGELHARRLALALAADPTDDAEVANARLRHGRHLIAVFRPAEAEAELAAVLELADGGRVEAVDVAEATRSLADVQRMLNRSEESERTARRAIELTDAWAGSDSIAGAIARGSLAQTLGVLGRFGEADALFQEAVDTLERLHGSDHLDRLTTMSNFSVLRLNAGDLAGAEALLREILEIGGRVHGERHPTVANYLQNHATVLARLGRLDEARSTYERVAAIYRDALDARNHVRALPLLSLSGIHLTQKRLPQAEAAAREALGVLRAALPSGHFITAVAECRMAQAVTGRNRSEAGALYASAMQTLLATTNVPDYRRECLRAAAAFYRAQGDSGEADRLLVALDGSGG